MSFLSVFEFDSLIPQIAALFIKFIFAFRLKDIYWFWLCETFTDADRLFLHSSFCFGNVRVCRQMTVGKLSQTTQQVADNILCCVRKLASSLPGGWNNVRSLHLKAQDTPSVPVYVSFGNER